MSDRQGVCLIFVILILSVFGAIYRDSARYREWQNSIIVSRKAEMEKYFGNGVRVVAVRKERHQHFDSRRQWNTEMTVAIVRSQSHSEKWLAVGLFGEHPAVPGDEWPLSLDAYGNYELPLGQTVEHPRVKLTFEVKN